MSYTVSKLDERRPYGVNVHGLRLGDLTDSATCEALRALWAEHGLVVFKTDPSPELQIAVSKIFGELDIHPAKEILVEGRPELLHLRHDQEIDPWLYDVGGKIVGAYTPWHFDLAFVKSINQGAVLRSVTLPKEGGDTGFVDGVEAYDTLPDDLKEAAEGHYIEYKMESDHAKNRWAVHSARASINLIRSNDYMKSVNARQDRDFPSVFHPIVTRHAITGKKMLRVSPLMAVRVHGMEDGESDELMAALVSHITSPDISYYHRWSTEDMLLWDNFRMIHTATGVPQHETREMHRTTISGNYGLGRSVEEMEADLEPAK